MDALFPGILNVVPCGNISIKKNVTLIRDYMNKRIVRLIIYMIVGFAAAFLYSHFKK